MMDKLDCLRGEIDAVDAALTELYERRRELTAQVGEYKRGKGLGVTDPKREAEALAARRALLRDRSLGADLTALFELIMSQSRRQQRLLQDRAGNGATEPSGSPVWREIRRPLERPTVAYQGLPGAYGEEAAALFFGKEASYIHTESFEGVFTVLSQGRADYGVVPIENSSTGAINAVYDLLGKYGFYIVGEQSVRVCHCLLAPRGAVLDGIRQVYSHEQGFFQSEEYLRRYPQWQRIPLLNTAEAARFVAESGDPARAAIASSRAADIYSLTVLAEGINFSDKNSTRFVVVSPGMEIREGADKISALFTLEHESGSLYRALSIFAVSGLNLLKIESRPIPDRSWEYRFFVDFSGRLGEGGMDNVIRELRENSRSFQILGNYRSNMGEAM
ncbi:bifunctional chorismate mutase/prephenate dehydratase [Papillibacter cinnamivorans]|uniref:Bifunctional chorismate mutase/prephenate dehydratase n=1 Tax=Papillibacter cinnamivorans DSM 12816 TaxID=1122930 RepID=A0A1W2BVR2_9FIRM|nr:bifunctional chorismate mutase/prephenate dehydratase [Papillibacter cinnamivorans]SMC76692.1 chorismate mutase / prephenate dehydratase [Papillibacter cinnamivorans DSM 12816]